MLSRTSIYYNNIKVHLDLSYQRLAVLSETLRVDTQFLIAVIILEVTCPYINMSYMIWGALYLDWLHL